MKLVEDLLGSVALLDCPVKRVCIGLHWTMVESRYVGMSHTYKTGTKVELESSGELVGRGALELTQRMRSWEPLEASLGLAALNSLIEPSGSPGNVFEHVVEIARGKKVAVIGRFPSNDRLEEVARRAYFFEMDPRGGELPSFACEEFLPEVDLAVITATALINKTLPRLLELSEHATSIVLGPSTPMNDVLFDHGADVVAGVRVVNADSLIHSIMQGVKKFGKIAGIEAITRRSVDFA